MADEKASLLRGTETLNESFIKYRTKKFNRNTDDALQAEGERILKKYDPEFNKLSKFNTHSILWMFASMVTLYVTDFFLTIRYDPRIDRFWFYVGVGLISINFTIGLFFVIVFQYLRKDPDYERRFPFAIPVATLAFVIGMIFCCIGLWPVWGLLTPLILFILCMGGIFFLSILPLG